MNKSLKLFTIFGITVKVHVTFLLLPAFIGFSLLYAEGGMAALRGIVLIVIIFAFVTFHELSHSLVAKKYKTKVKDITLLPIGGVASMQGRPEKPKQEFLIAIAGPMFNLVLAAILFYPVYFIIGEGLKGMSIANLGFGSWKAILLYIFWINPILAFFNLLPAFPMDGGRALRAFLAQRLPLAKATRIAVSLGHTFAVIFGLVGFLAWHPLLIIIAFFIYVAASQEEKQVNLKLMLREFKVKDVLNEKIVSIKRNTPLTEVLQLSRKTTQGYFPVIDNGALLGVISLQSLLHAASESLEDKTAEDIANKNVLKAKPDDNLSSVYDKMASRNQKVVAILKENKLQGLITIEDIARAYRIEQKDIN
jgi:Zn-dependent protease/predicted transcriptional regulator